MWSFTRCMNDSFIRAATRSPRVLKTPGLVDSQRSSASVFVAKSTLGTSHRVAAESNDLTGPRVELLEAFSTGAMARFPSAG